MAGHNAIAGAGPGGCRPSGRPISGIVLAVLLGFTGPVPLPKGVGLCRIRPLAVLREYATNARDSHVAAGSDRPIEVDLPSDQPRLCASGNPLDRNAHHHPQGQGTPEMPCYTITYRTEVDLSIDVEAAGWDCEWSNYLAHLDRAIWRYPRLVTTLRRAHTAAGDRPGRPM